MAVSDTPQEIFYPTPEMFAKETGCIPTRGLRRYGVTKVLCSACKKGTLWSVEQPRARWWFNQQTYRCDRCQSTFVVQFEKD